MSITALRHLLRESFDLVGHLLPPRLQQRIREGLAEAEGGIVGQTHVAWVCSDGMRASKSIRWFPNHIENLPLGTKLYPELDVPTPINRPLLEEIKAAILINLQKWRYKDEVVLAEALQKIEDELGKPEAGPDYWHVVGEDGESIYTSSFKQACHDHINDALTGADYYPEVEVATWVVRPLWSKP